MRPHQDRVVGIKLPVGEPEAVIGACIEPAAMMVLRAVRENIGGATEIVGDAVDELDQVVGAAIERSALQVARSVLNLRRLSRARAIIARRRRLRAERIKSEIPAVLVELQIAARALQIVVDP